jgi:DNA-binding transcriptional LysR family regulator
MHPNANDLMLFALIADSGSFAQAGAHCGLPRSTVSRRLSALEARLGERLLTRSTRRLALTELGSRILEHARRLREEAEAATAIAQHSQGKPRGVLRVSMLPDFAELDLSPLLMDYARTYPEVRLELDLSPRRVDLIAERFDLAIRAASRLPDDSTLVARMLIVLQNGLYASPGYLAQQGNPSTPAELDHHIGLGLIGGTGETIPWRLTREKAVWEGLPRGPLAANSPSLQRDLAIQGMGIVGLTDRFATAWVKGGYLRRILPDWQLPAVTIWSVMPSRHLVPIRTRAFIEMLRNTLSHDHRG